MRAMKLNEQMQRVMRPLIAFAVRGGFLSGCLVLAALCWARPAAAQGSIGYVVDLEGRWLLNDNAGRVLSKGNQIPAGAVISADSPSQYDYIVIADLGGHIMASRRCRTSRCDSPLALPRSAAPQPSTIGVVLQTVMNLLWGEPARYSVHRVRDGELPDAVVRLKSGKVDLSPVFKQMKKESYQLEWRPLPPHDSPATARALKPLRFDWNPARPKDIAAPDLRPGLYLLSLLEPNGKELTDTHINAWVLVADPAAYDGSTNSFRQAAQLASGWGTNVSPESARSFLRAYLDHLARGAGK
jgi:hypothetical protein